MELWDGRGSNSDKRLKRPLLYRLSYRPQHDLFVKHTVVPKLRFDRESDVELDVAGVATGIFRDGPAPLAQW